MSIIPIKDLARRVMEDYNEAMEKLPKPWVGLTDDDKLKIKKSIIYDQFETAGEYANRVQAATEAALKEKNGG